MPDPTFSVVVPAYNAAETIESAVRSVLDQTRRDLEVVVVDDGSEDDTSERAAAAGDERVVVVQHANGGTAVALNTGVAHARGTYVCLLGADDLYLPTFLEELEQALAAAPDAALAYADAWIMDGRSHRISRVPASASQHPPIPPPRDPHLFLSELLDRNFVFGLCMVRRSVLLDVGPFLPALRNRQDHEMWMRIAAHGYRMIHVPRLLAIYRRTPGGRRISVSSRLLAAAEAEREIYRLVAEEYDVPEPLREKARGRMADVQASIDAIRRSESRRRFVPRRVRRPLGRVYRSLRAKDTGYDARGNWFDVTPPDVAAAFPDLEER